MTTKSVLENVRNKPGKIVEENNNEVDMLTENFQVMGNIADKCKNAVEKPELSSKIEPQDSVEYDYGSDEFEEDIGDDGEEPQCTTIEIHPPKNDTKQSSSRSAKKVDSRRVVVEKQEIVTPVKYIPKTPTPRKTSSNSTLFR